ncbi:MAG: laccase domain-containing protein, partial [Clostridia bacterium]|nr:laccase domain-containing protein [Clostridia bacterium]
YDPKKKVVATSHSGWRGTVAEIGKKTVGIMASDYGCNPKDIIAAIGPSILNCCYEVDDPVINEIKKLSYLDFQACFSEKENGKYMLNLAEVNREILINAGLSPENIDVSDLCTCCNSEYLHSHRKTGGKRGNLAAFISLT